MNENIHSLSNPGKLSVIVGGMFCGKTEELIRRAKRAVIGHKEIQVFKPGIDNRYGLERVVSHSKTDLEIATGVAPVVIFPLSGGRLTIADKTESVFFDETQFFDEEWIVPVISGLVKDGIDVTCAGLDLNTYGEPFGCIPALMALADEIIKLKAVCNICKRDASRTFRMLPFGGSGEAIEVGGKDLYEARCLGCWCPTPRE